MLSNESILNTEIKNKGFALLDQMFKENGWHLVKNEMNYICYSKFGHETDLFEIYKKEQDIIRDEKIKIFELKKDTTNEKHIRYVSKDYLSNYIEYENSVEVIVSGKLRAQRAKAMKFKDGYMIKAGEAAKVYSDIATRHVLLRQGTLGVKVRIMLNMSSLLVSSELSKKRK
jgi:hypothetical protein